MDEISILSSRMKTGLQKLIEATKSVDELSKELVIKEKDLAVASKEAEQVYCIALLCTFSFAEQNIYLGFMISKAKFAFCEKSRDCNCRAAFFEISHISKKLSIISISSMSQNISA